MPSLSPDKQLLEYLRPFGVGNYQSIFGVLHEIFPIPEQYSGNKLENYYANINSFLSDMESNGFIRLKNKQTFASIQPKGIEYISGVNTGQTKISVTATNSQIFNQSSLSSNESISPIIQTTSSSNDKKSSTSSVLEKLYWVGGIVVALIAVYEICSPHLKGRADEPIRNDLNTFTQIPAKKGPLPPRHITKEDIKTVMGFMPSKSYKAHVYYSGQGEDEAFAKEFIDSLNLGSMDISPRFYIDDIAHNGPQSFQGDTLAVPGRFYLVLKKEQNLVEVNVVRHAISIP